MRVVVLYYVLSTSNASTVPPSLTGQHTFKNRYLDLGARGYVPVLGRIKSHQACTKFKQHVGVFDFKKYGAPINHNSFGTSVID